MRTVIQRTAHASCTVEGKITGKIEKGYMLLTGFSPEDSKETAAKMALKISKLRFGADMKIELLNDGPVTIILDSKEIL